MANELILDIVDVGEVRDTPQGYQAQRKALVTNMSAITPAAKLVRALTLTTIVDVNTGERMPQRGDPYPALPGIICLNRTARLINDTSTCEVLLDYGVPTLELSPPSDTAPPQIEVGATVIEVETSLDVNGNVITVSYTPPLAPGEVGPAIPITQTGTVRKQIPSVYFRFRRREPYSPGDKAKQYVGTMNSTVVFNDPVKYWLCTGITGTSNDFGASYDVTYEFLRNEDTWDAVVAYIDPETNSIPTNASFVGVGGLSRHVIYRGTNFYDLNI